MADYFPLIAKAVAALAPDTCGENRRALYDRVRAALLSELRIADPPFTDFQIMRERLALEDAVRRVEEEAAPLGRDAIPMDDELAADANDSGFDAELPFMIVGSATGKLNRVWRFAWR